MSKDFNYFALDGEIWLWLFASTYHIRILYIGYRPCLPTVGFCCLVSTK